jgi:hypothetical protein
MADGINIRLLPEISDLSEKDIFIVDNEILGTRIAKLSSLFSSEFFLESTTTLISGGVSPSGSIIPQKIGTLYFSSNTKDYFISTGTSNDKDWKRILTVGY